MKNLPSFKQLIHELNQWPGVGLRTAERLAYHILCSPKESVWKLRSALKKVKEDIRECKWCFSFTEEDICYYCRHPLREKHVICVVEDPGDLWRIEESGVFKGLYHVLRGMISPLKNKGPEDLTLSSLFSRLKSHPAPIEELILAFDSDLEGETTALYIMEQLKNTEVKVTRLAQGLPIGGHIDHTDERTLGKAIENRVQL